MITSDNTGTATTILVVEDAHHVRRLICRMLAEYGFAVLQAGSGAEALTLANQHVGSIDLLLSDVFMRSMNGCDLAAQVTALRPSTAVLLMSGEPQSVLDKLSWYSIQKPFSAEALVAQVQAAIAGTAALGRRASPKD